MVAQLQSQLDSVMKSRAVVEAGEAKAEQEAEAIVSGMKRERGCAGDEERGDV